MSIIDLSQAKPGDVFLTRCGGVAEYVASLANFRRSTDLLHVLNMDSQTLVVLPSNGRLLKSADSDIDIIAKKPEKRVLELWVSVYEGGEIGWSPTKDEADEYSRPGRIACLHIRREYGPGEGL